MRRTMIACSMMEDEIKAAMAELQIDIPIEWMRFCYATAFVEMAQMVL